MEQKDFIDKAELWFNIDLSWCPWTGKTYILKELIQSKRDKWYNVVVVAPTWIAAINVWWTTIHSTFSIFWNNYDRINSQKVDWRYIDLIVIDEKSMIWPDLLDHISNILCKSLHNDKPFWWKQVILCGDIAQLPPIYKKWNTEEEVKNFLELRNKYWKLIYTSSISYKQWNFIEVNLDKVYRQKEEKLLSIINNIREWNFVAIRDLRNDYTKKQYDESVHIMPYNNMVDSHNLKQYSKIKNKEFVFNGKVTGKFNLDNVLTPEILKLKKGTRVMLTRNIFTLWLYNWDLWEVKDFVWDWVLVFFDRLQREEVISKATWEQREWISWEETITWKFTQIPLKLSYALTNHKVQWLTIDKVIIHYVQNMSIEALYVWVSRAVSYDNIFLYNWLWK